jgi:heat shock protein HtpX
VSEPAAPVLVYDRIAENRRRSWLLLGVFVLILIPFGLGLVPLGIPLIEFGALLPLLGDKDFDRVIRTAPGTLHLGAAVLVLTAVVVAGVCVAVFEFHQATRLVLRIAAARLMRPDEQPALRRTVEGLCLGAGLPVPAIYLVNTAAPNAFAAGLDPERAVVVVTQGLLDLLDRRDLQAVIAHELSHIGNHDIRLSTLLAAVVTTLRIPLAVVFRLGPLVGMLVIGVSALLFILVVLSVVGMVAQIVLSLWYFSAEMVDALRTADPRDVMFFAFFLFYSWLFAASPLYVLVGAQLCGLSVRGAVSRQREFLADADAALLTRDPEGLALALAKIEGAAGMPMKVTAAAAHLYLADPMSVKASWWDRRFASHPPIDDRIAALANIGSGISPAALEAARAAGVAFRRRLGEPLMVRGATTWLVSGDRRDAAAPEPAPGEAATGVSNDRPVPGEAVSRDVQVETWVRVLGERTPLFDAPESGGPRRQLPAGSLLALLGVQGAFLRVRTTDDVVGYIPRSTRVSWESS